MALIPVPHRLLFGALVLLSITISGAWGSPAERARGKEDSMRIAGEEVSMNRESVSGAQGRRAAVLVQEGGEEVARLAGEALREAGVETEPLAMEALADPARFNRSRYDFLVLPRSEATPALAQDNLLAFLHAGGHLVAFGSPPFTELVWFSQGKWQRGRDILAGIRPDAGMIDFATADLAQWGRGPSAPYSSEEWRLVPGPEGTTALQLHLSNFSRRDSFSSPALTQPFPPGHTLTCFWAKGDARTSHMSVTWDDQDDVRWIAAVDLSPEWCHYALRPEDFKRTDRRRAPAALFNPAQAVHLGFGVGETHDPGPVSDQTYWVAAVGAAPSPFPVAEPEPPMLPGFSPVYKTYEMQLDGSSHQLAPDPDQRFFPSVAPVPISGRVISPQWGQRGLGSDPGPRGRWIPLLRVSTKDGHYRGAAASVYFSTADSSRGATWTYIGMDARQVAAYWSSLEPALVGAVKRIADGRLLVNGGTDRFSYVAGNADHPRLVAQVATIGPSPADARIRFTIADASGRTVLAKTAATQVEPGRFSAVSETGAAVPAGRYRVGCELLGGDGAPIDRISYEFSVIAPPARTQFVTVRNGSLQLGGREWHPHGINYSASFGGGLESADFSAYWLTPWQYDPEVIERDLALLQSLGTTMVAVSYYSTEQAATLADFLQRAKNHGILVNLYIAGADPLAIDEAQVESLVRTARLAENDAVFAYDIAWEPILGGEEERSKWDPAWAKWLVERYGSIEAAERDWGHTLRRIDGQPTGPTNAELTDDGPHRPMVAAYRRFADDLISEGYGKATGLLRRLDPNHLIGARTGWGGTGQPGAAPYMPFDLVSGAAHLDFMTPEGWGLSGDWTNFERAGFTTLYGRWASNGKPVYWGEYGYNLHPGMKPHQLESQAEVFRNLYRMVLQSGAAGSAGWWFPGGLRVGENSDYGIINPDGTLRPAAEELAKAAPATTAPRPLPKPDMWITIDRDPEVSGYAGIWGRHVAAYLDAVRAGKHVGLRTEADGTTSGNVPLVAVGGKPYDGHNVPKYLNAEFGEITVLDAANPAQAAAEEDSAAVEVPAGRPVRIRVQITNTSVAEWLSPANAKGNAGGVYVASGERGGIAVRAAISRDVPRYGETEVELVLPAGVTARTEITLAMEAEGRAWFGQRRKLVLTPVR